jgi:SAM-dependent methyltransferase
MATKPESASATNVETIDCPLCHGRSHTPWGSENGYQCVKCSGCGLLYVNPRPCAEKIDHAVQMGNHPDEKLDVVGSRVAGKVAQNRRVIESMFGDLLKSGKPFSWLDVGAGFGELVEAVMQVAPTGCVCEGLEPMIPKANDAIARGLPMRTCYLNQVDRKYDVVSLIDVFSHIPDFGAFLADVKRVLNPGGEVLMKTGNAGDIGARTNFPGPLTLPDHLVFGGEDNIRRFLSEAGFDIVAIERHRIDGLVYSARNMVKWMIGRPVSLSVPYTSKSRTLYVRAKLRG